jgi:hypothetical protein
LQRKQQEEAAAADDAQQEQHLLLLLAQQEQQQGSMKRRKLARASSGVQAVDGYADGMESDDQEEDEDAGVSGRVLLGLAIC